jgi:hypothetical protein
MMMAANQQTHQYTGVDATEADRLRPSRDAAAGLQEDQGQHADVLGGR